MAIWTIIGSGYKDHEGSGGVNIIDVNTSALTMADNMASPAPIASDAPWRLTRG